MPILEIKEFSGGISAFADRGIRGSFKFGSGLDIRKSVDTLSCQQDLVEEGLFGTSHSSSPSISQSPSQSPSRSSSASTSPSNSPSKSQSPSASPSKSDSASQSPSASESPSSSVSPSPSPSAGLNTVYRDLVMFWVKASDGATYGFGNAGHIYRRYEDSFTRMVYTDPDGSIKGAVEKPSSTTTYLQWATNTKLMRKPLPGRGDWGDVEVIGQNLTGTDWHTMKQVGGANYIANGSKVALVGYDDSYTNDALNIVPGKYIKTVIEREGKAVFGTYPAGYPNKGVNGAIDCEVPLIQIGEEGDIYFSNFSDTMPIRKFPGGGRVNPGGVSNEVDQVDIFAWEQDSLSWTDKQTLGNMSLWGVFNADSGKNGVYTYGRKNKEQPLTLNLEYALEVDEIGAVVNIDGTTIISYRDGNDFGVKAVDPNNKAQGIWEGLEFRSPVKYPINITTYNYVEVLMSPLPAGSSVKFYYKKNKTGDWVQASLADGSDAYTIQGGNKAIFRLGEEMDIYEPRLVLTPYGNNSPEILRLRTYFK